MASDAGASLPGARASEPPTIARHGDRIPLKFLLAYGAATLGLWVVLLTPVIITLPLRVGELAPGTKEASLSLILGVGAVFGLISNPVFGRLSDRTTSRWGMRRPWLLGGALTAFAGLLVMAAATSIPVLLIGWCVVSASLNAMLAVLLAVLPDHVAPHRRGMVSGILGMCQALAAAIGIALVNAVGDVPFLMFVAPGVVTLLTCLWLVAVLPDRRLAPADRPPFGFGELLRSFWVNPVKHPDFGWAWLSRFLIFMSISSVLNYQVYYLTDGLGLPTSQVAQLVGVGVLIQTVTVVLGSNVFGWLSDKVGRRKVFVLVSALVGSAGLLTLTISGSVPGFLFGMVLIGLGQGVYFAVDLALVTEVLPDSEQAAGKDLGVFNIANSLPQAVAPAIAPLFIGIGTGQNYTALFLAGTIFAVLSALAIAPVRGVR
jgi:MFS family permease